MRVENLSFDAIKSSSCSRLLERCCREQICLMAAAGRIFTGDQFFPPINSPRLQAARLEWHFCIVDSFMPRIMLLAMVERG